MQVGGSCASGTLFAVGSGQTAIGFTLVGFIAGSVVGAWHSGFWAGHLQWRAVSLANSRLGYAGALAVSLVVMAAVVSFTLGWEHPPPPPGNTPAPAAVGAPRGGRGSSAL